MKLTDLLVGTEYKIISGNADVEINSLVFDSRKISAGDVFVCIPGAVCDGHAFIPDAVSKHAAAVIIERDMDVCGDITVIRVDDCRLALACMSAAFFGYPAEKIKTIGITGTKGKTTTTYMVREVLESVGIKTGLIGTIETVIGDKKIPANNTTPESYVVQETFSRMVEEGCKCVVMEVSSQGLMQHRVSGFEFDYGIFTNIEPDHIGKNEHKDFDEYLYCKSLLFKQCRTGIVNVDDAHIERILDGCTCDIETFGINNTADLLAENIRLFKDEGCLGIRYHLSLIHI